MRRLTKLYLDLDATTRTSDKVALLTEYFNEVPDADAAWAVALLLGERPKGAPSSTALRTLALEQTGLPGWMLSECRAAVGDLSETLALLIPERDPAADNTEPLYEVMQHRVLALAGASDDEREAIIADAWSRFSREERLVYHKLLRGGFRVGVQRSLVARALARLAGVEQAEMEHRLAGVYTPTPEAYRALLVPTDDDAPRPFPFLLARPFDADPAELGDPAEWIAEWKWDGIRAQLVRTEHDIQIWSRGQELITNGFPEITAAATALPPGTTLDGEILMWDDNSSDTGRPRPFARLQRRLNRDTPPSPQPGLFDTERIVFIAFDLLRDAGDDLRTEPQHARRDRLARRLQDADNETIRLSEPVPIESWPQLTALRETSRDRGVEGLVLKHRDSPYGSGRTAPSVGGGWRKWKIDPYTIDAVLTHAYPGSGRRASLYTDFGFSLWGERDGQRTLITFTRAYSGLTQDEIEQLDRWIRRHTTRRMGPVREVEPELVFEIAFEAVARSARHAAGMAVRFPRILRQRTDKAPSDADKLETLAAMLR